MKYKCGDKFKIRGEMYILAQIPLVPKRRVHIPTHLLPRIALFCLSDGNHWGGYIEVENCDCVSLDDFHRLIDSIPDDNTKHRYEIYEDNFKAV